MWQRWLFLFSLVVFSVSSWADDSCSVQGNKDFDVTVTIDSYEPSQSYDISYSKNGVTLLWSNHDQSALFYEPSLDKGQKYQLRFFYHSSADALTYYKNKNDAAFWSEGETKSSSLHNGASIFMQSGASSIACSGPNVEPPAAMPDVCTLVPDTLQTNSYSGGVPFGNLSTTPGAGNQIYLPTDTTKMSFQSTASTDCYYPSGGGPITCQVDPQKTTPNYPWQLDDTGFDGSTLDIATGETKTLDSGEYWFNSITFGGDGSSLAISGPVVIHYKQLNIPKTGDGTHIHINDGGAPKDLLFIGHGDSAAIVTENDSAAIISNAHYYVDSTSEQGLALGGNNSSFDGGFAANVVSLSGTNNVFSGEDGCGDVPTPTPEPDDEEICTYFPGALQGNRYENGKVKSNLIVSQGNGALANRVYLDSHDPLSFAYADTSNITESNTSGCVYRKDDSGNYSVDGHFNDGTTEGGDCLYDPDLVLFDGNPYVPPDFSTDGAKSIPEDQNKAPEFVPGTTYNTVTFPGNNLVTTIPAGEYWVDTLQINANDVQVKTDGQVIIHYKHIKINGTRVYINADTSRSSSFSSLPTEVDYLPPDNLNLIGHGSESGVDLVSAGLDIYINANWYVSPDAEGFTVASTDRFQYIGSLVAPDITLTDGADYTYIYPAASVACTTPEPDESYTIEVTPDNGYALTCNAPNITFTVRGEDGEVAKDYAGNINATFPNGLVPDNDNIIQGKVIDADNNIYQPIDGQVIVPVTAGEYKQFTVDGELADDTTQTDSGSIEFVPFKFGIEDQHVIANKSQSVTVQALACDSEDTGKEVAVNYSGTPDVVSNLTEPEQGVGDLTFAPEFTNENAGEVNSDLTFTDSGKLTVTLEDKNFDCTGLDGCPIGDDGKTDGVLKGSFTVYSRPWTFAICDADGTNMDGNITDAASQGFKAAGEEFSLNIKPLRWVEGDSDPVTGSPDIDVTELCDKPITQNFTASDSPKATIQLDYQLSEPTVDAGGHEGALFGTQSLVNTEHAGSGESAYYDFSGLYWSEVGVITMQVSVDEAYYDMTINKAYRNIGRFYPHHLALVNDDSVWAIPTGQTDFIYMNQPTHMEYTVEAENATDDATENYGYFSDALLAKMRILAVDSTQNNAEISTERYTEDTAQVWDGADYQYSTGEFVFYKSVADDLPYTSQADGPYNGDNSVWGVLVTDETVDNVNFEFDEQGDDGFQIDNTGDRALSFIQKPDFRYGRMTLDNVSGPIGGPVSVPMRVEYWDGVSKSFVVNEADSGSDFISSVYCAIDDDSGDSTNNAFLTDSDDDKATHTVDEGKSGILLAQQNNAQKQTARIFLRQGSDDDKYFSNPTPANTDCEWNNDGQSVEQPWLQYNWREGKGDEDPSTVVTFGAYRGNDRIIYRGEPELTAN